MTIRREIIEQVLTETDGVPPRSNSPLKKHVKMAGNPFRFLRGSAPLFYRDLAERNCPSIPGALLEQIPLCMVQGDCHVSNFGFISEEGSHGDRIIFSLNDFDDACVGHASWDLLRYLTSLFLAQDYLQGIIKGRYTSAEEFDSAAEAPGDGKTLKAAEHFIEAYIEGCQASLDDRTARDQVVNRFSKDHVLNPLRKKAVKRAAGGKNFASKSALAKAAVWCDGAINFDLADARYSPLGVATSEALKAHFAPFMDDAILDVVERLDAGTGSVNLTRYYFLVGPEQGHYPRDLALCHIVEVKQQRPAAPLAYFKALSPVNRLNPAHLTQVCQRRMQRQPDLILDETEWQEAHWLVRSRHHAKVGIDPEHLLLSPHGEGHELGQYAEACGRALALAHMRADRRSTRFEESVCEYMQPMAKALIESAYTLAEKTKGDWGLLTTILKR